MKIIKLEKNMLYYHLPSMSTSRLGQNIYALLDGHKALLIDSGYKRECQLVLDDLLKRGIKVVSVVPTHFHPDHVEGITIMDHPKVYGHALAVKTLKRFYKEDYHIMAPTDMIDHKSVIIFGEFELTFEHAPGHSDCSMLVFINNKYMHLGDLYIRLDNGADVLPYATWKGAHDHMMSLDKVVNHIDRVALISHGLCPVNKQDLSRGIKDRKIYLEALLRTKNRASAKEAVEQCSQSFESLHWKKDTDE